MNFERKIYKQLKYYRKNFDGSIVEKRSTYLLGLNQLATIQLASILLHKKKSECVFEVNNNDCVCIQQRINNKTISVDNTKQYGGFSFIEIYDEYRSLMSHCNLIDHTDVEAFLISHDNGKEICDDLQQVDQEIENCIETRDFLSPKASASGIQSSNLRIINILTSYLRLMINVKDEIALSRVIDCPVRGITHKAFTDIRQIAQEKSLSMYQTISSFVRKLSLGGKGYAPSENHVLLKVKEGLADFMELMDKLQNLADDSVNHQETMKKLLKTLKSNFVRSKTPTFKQDAVNKAVDHLVTKYQEFVSSSPEEYSQFIFHAQDFHEWLLCCHGYDIPTDYLLGVLSTPNSVEKTILRKMPSLKRQFITPETVVETRKRPRIQIQVENQMLPQNNDIINDEKNENLQLTSPPSTPIQENAIKLIRCHQNNSPLAVAIDYSPECSGKIRQRQDITSGLKKQQVCKTKKFETSKENKPKVKTNKPKSKENKTKPIGTKTIRKKNNVLPGQKSISQFFK